MKKHTLLLILVFFTTISFAQKKLWAKSFINKPAPKFIIEKWISQEPDTKGKFILVDFWATWCGPCRKAIPKLNSFHKEFKDDLIVIGLSDESELKVNKQQNPKIEYYNAIDTQKRLNSAYEVKGIPHCVLINPDGIVVWEGWPDLEEFELTTEVIRDLIKKNKG